MLSLSHHAHCLLLFTCCCLSHCLPGVYCATCSLPGCSCSSPLCPSWLPSSCLGPHSAACLTVLIVSCFSHASRRMHTWRPQCPRAEQIAAHLVHTLSRCLSHSQSYTHTHFLSFVLVAVMKSKELKTKISHAHSLILSHWLSLWLAHTHWLSHWRSVFFSLLVTGSPFTSCSCSGSEQSFIDNWSNMSTSNQFVDRPESRD